MVRLFLYLAVVVSGASILSLEILGTRLIGPVFGVIDRPALEHALRDLRYRELELVEQRRALRGELERMDIRAPVSGIVYGLQVRTPRSVVRAAEQGIGAALVPIPLADQWFRQRTIVRLFEQELVATRKRETR